MSPGSYPAKSIGCTCPEIANAYGAGILNAEAITVCFVVNHRCPMHGAVRWQQSWKSQTGAENITTTLVYGKSTSGR